MKSTQLLMFRDTKGKIKQNFLSVIVTLLVIGVLIWSGPAQAVTLSIQPIDGNTPSENTAVTFQISADIAPGEMVPVQNLTLYIGPQSCTFGLDGTPLSGPLCGSVSIIKDSSGVPYGYGSSANMYGYGYGYNYSAGAYNYYNATFGAGYGYGYSPTIPTELTYNVTWTTPAVASNTQYSVRLEVYAVNAGEPFKYSKTETNFFTVQNVPLAINSVGLLEADNFYSPYNGNNLVHVRVNASGATAVQADFSGIAEGVIDCGDGGVLDLVQQSPDIWNGTCDVSLEAEDIPMFAGGPMVVSATDGGAPLVDSSQSVVLYGLTIPPSPPCMQMGSETTNFSKVANFGTMNLVLHSLVNLSCMSGGHLPPGAPAWTNQYTEMALINFTSVDMSDKDNAQKIMDVSKYLDIDITPPGQFGNSRIYINSTYLAQLDTSAEIRLYHLPFSSMPAIAPDIGADTPTSVEWIQGTNEGTLIFRVSGFSGYDITDSIAPIIAFSSPAAAATLPSPVLVALSVNGTGTVPSYIRVNVSGEGMYYYNASNGFNSAQCEEVSTGSEKYTCTIPNVALSTGSKTISVYAVDFGGTAGISATGTRSFTVDASAPTTVANATTVPGGSAYTSDTWTTSNVSISLQSCTDSNGCSKTLVCTTANCNATLNYSIGTSFDITTEGTNYFRYKSNDSLGNMETVNEIIVKIDRTSPVVEITSPTSGSSSTSNANVVYTATDTNLNQCWWTSDGGATNHTLSCETDIVDQSWETGSNTIIVYASDSAGNVGSASISFTKTSSGSGGSSSGGGYTANIVNEDTTWSNTFVVSEIENLLNGYNKPLTVGERIEVRIAGGTHYIGILKIVGNVVTVQVSSTPQKADLGIGQSAKFDVNNDGYYDVYVKNNGILPGNKIDVLVMSIHELMPVVTTPQTQPPAPAETPAEQPPVTCTTAWSCGDWSECVDSSRSRVCVDSSNCGTQEGKPVESEKCMIAKKPIPFIAFIIAALIIIVLCLFTVIYIQKSKEGGY